MSNKDWENKIRQIQHLQQIQPQIEAAFLQVKQAQPTVQHAIETLNNFNKRR